MIKTMRLTKLLTKILLPDSLRKYAKTFLHRDIDIIDKEKRDNMKETNTLNEETVEDLVTKDTKLFRSFMRTILRQYKLDRTLCSKHSKELVELSSPNQNTKRKKKKSRMTEIKLQKMKVLKKT